MDNLSAAQLLGIWERGVRRAPLDRALVLLSMTETGASARDLVDVPIGSRDHALLGLRTAAFGRIMSAYIDCPACQTRLELSLDTESFRADVDDSPIQVGGFTVRRPTTRDLASISNEADPDRAAYRLAQRCISKDGGALELTDEDIRKVEEALSAVDSSGDIVLDLSCDHCHAAWQCPFDAASFLWREIDTRARQLMSDVHTLAREYGWSEAEILSLSDERRAAYIDMVLS